MSLARWIGFSPRCAGRSISWLACRGRRERRSTPSSWAGARRRSPPRSRWRPFSRRSAHNQIYWHAEEYLALGPGAAGFLGDVRYTNVKPVERYCTLVESFAAPVAAHEVLTARQRIAERLILGLRLVDGIPTAWLDERIRLEPGRLPALLTAWRERGLLVENGGRARLTEEGFFLSDALFVELL